MVLKTQLALLIVSALVLSAIDALDDDETTASAPTTITVPMSSLETKTSTTAYSSDPKAGTQVDTKATVNKIEKNMKVTMKKTEDIMRIIKKRLAAAPGNSRAEDCLKTCMDVYGEAIDGMKDSIQDLSSGNYYKVNVDISAVSTDVETCDECYSEMLGEDPELKKFDLWIRGITNECLDDLESVSTGH